MTWRKQIKGNWTQVAHGEAGGQRKHPIQEKLNPDGTDPTNPRVSCSSADSNPPPTEITFLDDSLWITVPISTESRVSVSAWREPDGSSGSKRSSMKYVCPQRD